MGSSSEEARNWIFVHSPLSTRLPLFASSGRCADDAPIDEQMRCPPKSWKQLENYLEIANYLLCERDFAALLSAL
jgi:hypothetical protein